MRYAWDQFDAYFSRERYGTIRYATIRAIIASLRRWDRATASRVDAFAANSAWVAGRISRYYGRSATVIPPPVDTEFFVPEENIKPEDYYLVVSALSPYKCNEAVLEAFNRMQRRLVVVGTGPDKERLEALAGPTVEMLGRVDDKELRSLYQGCSGVILAAVEDAGIVPVEVMACGRPPLVLARGGASEAIRDGVTGTLIQEQTPEAIIEAIDRSEATPFNSEKIRASALRYAPDRFLGRFSTFINTSLENLH